MKWLAACVLAVLGALSVLSAPLALAQMPDLSKALGQLLGNKSPVNLPSLPGTSSASSGGASGGVGAALGSIKGADLMELLTVPLSDIDLPREREIGRQLASVLLGSKPLHPDAALQTYINQLGRWVSLQSTRPDLPWAFAVLDDRGYNAFAAPGGYVFVTKGLIDQLTDEGELAAILAHEIAHVTEKHHLKALKSGASTGAMARMGAQLLGSQVKNSTVRGVLSDQGVGLVRDLYSKGLDRGDEYEADRHAVTVATRAGFDPYGLFSVLQGLTTARSDNPMFTLALNTHPPTESRLEQLEAAMGKRLDAFPAPAPVSIAKRLEWLKTHPVRLQ
jgi:predicted Zn-dependent protease